MKPALPLSVCLLAALPVAAQEPRGLDLRELLRIAARSYPEVAVVESEVDAARGTEALARARRRMPRLNLTSAFGVVPGARGTVFDSPDSPRDLDNLGGFYRVRLEFQQPLFTFGALREAERAASAAVASRKERLRARRDVGLALAAEAYFGWQLAKRTLAVVDEVRGHLEQHLARLEADDGADPLDLYRTRNARFVLDRGEAQARRHLLSAEAGLEALAGRGARPATDEMVVLQADATSVDEGYAIAAAGNPELREAQLAFEARSHVAEATRRERLPGLGIDGRFEYGTAATRTKQDNPFVYDPWNVRSFSAAFGLRWDLSFKQNAAKVARETAEAEAARARRDAVATRLRLELGGLRARLDEATAVHETSRRALSTTANWLRVSDENHGLGTASTNDVIDSYTAYVQARIAHDEAVRELNLALVAFRLAQGREPLVEGEAP
jgi:outer membrane protein TolC